MVFGLNVGQHHAGEHVTPFRFASNDLTEKVIPVVPFSGNADD
jgi:hypothetical protein